MVLPNCCVSNCRDRGSRRHRFPHPEKDAHCRFWKWVEAVDLKNPHFHPMTIYKNKRVCDRHFSSAFRVEGEKKLKRNAIPDLNLPSKTACSPAAGIGGPTQPTVGTPVTEILLELGLEISIPEAHTGENNGKTACSLAAEIGGPTQPTVGKSVTEILLELGLETSTPEAHAGENNGKTACSLAAEIGGPTQPTVGKSVTEILLELGLETSTPEAHAGENNGNLSSPGIEESFGVEPLSSCSVSTLGFTTPRRLPGMLDVHGTPGHQGIAHPQARRSLFPDQGPNPGNKRGGVLHELGVRKAIDLTPKARSLYKGYQVLKRCLNRSSKKLATFRKRLRDADKILGNCGRECIASLPPTVSSFLLCQTRESSKKGKGRRFTLEDKVFALSLMKRSGRAYRFLSKVFVLPSRVTLLKFLSRLSFKSGINNDMFDHLSITVRNKVKDIDRHCIVMFDEVKLTPHLHFQSNLDVIEGFEDLGEGKRSERFADTALVFMVRGLRRNYKQPVAYVFPSGTAKTLALTKLIMDVISHLLKSGLKVCATVCDQGSSNVAAINRLCEETRRSVLRSGGEYRGDYFTVDGIEIIPLFDPPHLLKGVRNVLLNKDLKFCQDGVNKIASWRHVLQVYSIDKQKSNRMLPHLTDQHLIKEKIKKMKVKHCAQVFSSRLSSVMKMLSERPIEKEVVVSGEKVMVKDIDEEAHQTSDLLLFFDRLFDSVNGSNAKAPELKPLLCAISPSSPHLSEWGRALKVLRSMEYTDGTKTSRTPSLNNWGRTIQNMRCLWFRLHKAGFKRLALRNLNQDPLENKFGAIRSYGFRNNSPTCTLFIGAYKSLLLNDMVSSHSVGGNCEEDGGKVLDNLRDYLNSPSSSSTCMPPSPGDNFLEVTPAHLGVESTTISFSTFSVQAILSKVGVPECIPCRRNQLSATTTEALNSESIASSLCPSDIYCKVFCICRDMILRKLPAVAHEVGVGTFLRNHISANVDFGSLFCTEHHVSYSDKFCRHIVSLTVSEWCSVANKYLKGKHTGVHPNMDAVHRRAAEYFLIKKGPTPIKL